MQSLTVRRLDGSAETFKITPAVIVAFERNFNLGLGKAFGPGAENRMEHMCWMAWKANHQHVVATGQGSVKEFDKWLADVADIETDGDDVRPFDGAPSDD